MYHVNRLYTRASRCVDTNDDGSAVGNLQVIVTSLKVVTYFDGIAA